MTVSSLPGCSIRESYFLVFKYVLFPFLSLDIYRKSHDEIRLPNPPPLGLTQDLVVGIAPLKLRQNPPLVALPPTTNNEKDDDLKGSLGECEYRSLQLEGLKFAEEEKGGGKESASFPLTYGRRLEAAKIRLHHQISEKRELISSPHQTETNREEGPACRELQQKVHILEHVYNQECFLKVHSIQCVLNSCQY